MALKKALGRGLGSIINSGIVKAAAQPAKGAPQAKAQISVGVSSYGVFREVPIELVVPSKYQARREFSESEIQSLADSIASEGLIQPLIVRKSGDNYELIAGERRLRACRKLGLPANGLEPDRRGIGHSKPNAELPPHAGRRGPEAGQTAFKHCKFPKAAVLARRGSRVCGFGVDKRRSCKDSHRH